MSGFRSRRGLVVCIIAVAIVFAGFFTHRWQVNRQRKAVNAEASLLLQGGNVVLTVKNLGPAPLSITAVKGIDKARNDKKIVSYDPRAYLVSRHTDVPESLQSFPLDQLSNGDYLKTRGYKEEDYLIIQGIATDETGKEFHSNTVTIRFPGKPDIPPIPYIQ